MTNTISKFLTVTKYSPCPLCGRTRGCKTTNTELIFCMGEPSGQALERYVCVGESRDIAKLWRLWVLKKEGRFNSGYNPSDWNRSGELPAAKTFPSPLSPEQRHTMYRKLYTNFGLSHAHRKQLQQERGLTDDAIDLIARHQLLTSWLNGEWVNSFQLSDKLPPIKIDFKDSGKLITGCKNGLAIPALDLDGNILGQQIRPDNKAERETAKYIWDTAFNPDGTGYQAKLNDGSNEWPLAHWVYPGKDVADIKEVWYCEGFLKSLIVAATLWTWYKRTDVIVVGAASGAYGEKQISAIVNRYPNASHLLLPDSGAIQNVMVLRQYRALVGSLGNCSRNLEIAWWGQYEKCKGVDGTDVDEMIVNSTSLDFLSNRITHSEMFSLLDEHEAAQAEKYAQYRIDAKGLGVELSKEEWEARFGTSVSAKPKSPYEYWGYFKKNLVKMTRSTLDWARSLDSKWGELHDELPSDLGDSHILPASLSHEDDNTIYYKQGERLEMWKGFIKDKARYIFDRSTMGLGKSYDAGLLEPESLGVDKLIYIAAEHRNITTPTLESWVDLVPRHNGLVRDEHQKLRRRTDITQPWAVKPNCARTGLLALLRDRNIEAADAASTICQSCPHFEGCRSGSGDYTYLYDRGQTLQKSRFRCHPASLPPLDQFDYSANSEKMRKHKKPRTDIYGNQVYESPVRGTGLVWEEWSQILTDSKTIKANLADIHQLCGYLMQVNPELANRIQAVTSALASLMNPANQGKFGHGHFMIVKKLEIALGMPKSEWPSLFSDLIIELDKWTNPEATGAINQLFQIGDEVDGVDTRDLPKAIRDQLGKSEAELIATASATILKQWLPEFLGVISGMDTGLCNINFDQLTITICDKRLVHIAKAAAFNIFLDATEMPENLAAILGIEISDIVTVAQEVQPSDNHDIIQITGMGRLGSGRGNEQSRRLNEVLKVLAKEHPDLAIVDWKKFIDPDFGKELGVSQYAWWRDSRGTNDIYNNGCTAIALAGIPTKPLEQYRAQFACRYGYVPDQSEDKVTRWSQTSAGLISFINSESTDPKFRQFIYDDIQSTIEQGIGRLRASRRSDECLTIYLIADFAHRFPISWHVEACNVTQEAATKAQSLEMAILKAIQAMQDEQHAHANKPANITLTAIAERCGKNLSYLSQYIRKNLGWKSSDTFLEALQTLLFNSNSKTKYHLTPNLLNPNQTEHLSPSDKFLIDHYIPLAYDKLKDLEHLVPQILRHIFDHAAEYGRQCLPRILNALPNNIRQDILQFFFSLLPQDQLEELIT